MSNHVRNKLVIHASRIEHDAFVSRYCKGNELDFHRIIPIPGVYEGSYGQTLEKLFGRERCFRDACTRAWGTKWTSYSNKPLSATDDTLTLQFDTAWNAPHPIIIEIAKTCGHKVTHSWCCEGECTWGRVEYNEDGLIMTVACEHGQDGNFELGTPEPPQLTSEEAYAEIWPERASDEED